MSLLQFPIIFVEIPSNIYQLRSVSFHFNNFVLQIGYAQDNPYFIVK